MNDETLLYYIRSLLVNCETLMRTCCNCYCLLITTGARYIGELLQVNNVLQVLYMGWNNIGDDGISVIAGALGKSRIRELYVNHCGITDTGAKQLATGLSLNSSITVLEMWDNPITVEGAHLILQSAVNNKVCTLVLIDGKHNTDSEVRRMINILETRRKVKSLIIVTWYNCCHCTRPRTTPDLLMMERTRGEWLIAIVILLLSMVTLGLQPNFLDQVSHCYTIFDY